ncbi:WD40-repeat-containing domain protein [Lactarius indigo]|nr:WD40-repeat-containing domain protein [Lactarius indigo]
MANPDIIRIPSQPNFVREIVHDLMYTSDLRGTPIEGPTPPGQSTQEKAQHTRITALAVDARSLPYLQRYDGERSVNEEKSCSPPEGKTAHRALVQTGIEHGGPVWNGLPLQRTGWDVERHRIIEFPPSLSTFMTQTTLLQYEAPWPVHAIDWCKSPAPGQQLRPRSAFRLGIASFAEDFRNRIAVVGLQDDRVLVEDDYGDYPDFVTLVEVNHGYPATALQWQPGSASSFAWSQKSPTTELLATTGDSLRVFEYTSDAPLASSSYVGRQPSGGGHRLSLKAALSGQSKVQGQSGGAPLTNFSWNEKIPSLVVTSSIDTTCTVWNLDTSTAVTQLIAHDREVYDVALEHSTILYETPPPKNQPPSGRPPSSPLLRIAFNPSDANYMSTFHQDGSDVQILDMRSPGAPVMELRAHRAPINAAGWSSTEGGLVATAGTIPPPLGLCMSGLLIFNNSQRTTASYSCGISRLTHPRRRRHHGMRAHG